MGVPSRTSAPTPALIRESWTSDHPREGAPTFTPPRRGSSTGSDHCSPGGRRKVDDADAAKARQLRDKGISATDIAKMLGVSRATVYRYLADDAA